MPSSIEWKIDPESPPDVSVIMACRNEAAHIERALDSLLAQQLGGLRAEFLIADGASTDSTREIVSTRARDCHAPIRLLDNPRRIVSTGLNLAIRAARGPVIVRVDAHTEYASDYVARCVETLRNTEADNVGGPARTRTSGFIGEVIAAAYHSPFACGGARFHQENFEGWVDTVTYGCWHKQTLFDIGLFDESLVRNQDDELNLRLVRSGRRIWQTPAIVSHYHPRSSLLHLFKQYFEYGYWKVRVIRKHHLPASLRHLVPGMFVLTVTILPLLAGVAWILSLQPVVTSALVAWAVILTSYLAVSIFASILTAKQRGWRLLPLLPVVFALYHIAYGAGFLAGIASLVHIPDKHS